MALLPEDVVRAHVAEELSAARAWTERHGLSLDADEAALTMRVPLVGGGADGASPERYLLTAALDDYRAIPPAWKFVHPDTGEDIGPAALPANTGSPPTSIFHPAGVICAHFNRLAYAEHGGPHGDWGNQANWLNAAVSGHARADTIADMLARIATGVRASTSRMAPLP